MADWLQLDPNVLPWMRRQGEAAREATEQFQFGAQMAERKRQNQIDNAYRDRVLQLQQETMELKRVSELQSREGMVEMGRVLSEISVNGDWTNPAAKAKFFDVVTRYPALASSPIYDNLLQTFQAAEDNKLRRDLANQQSTQGFAPGPLEKDIEYYRRVLSEGDPEIIALVRSTLQSRAQKSGFSVKFGPDGRVEEILQGPQAAAGAATTIPTTAVKTDLQKDINNTRHSLSLVSDLSGSLRAEDVGIRGVIGENLMDRLLPQFGINTLDPKRTDNRTKLRTLVQGMLRQISPDNRFTNEDRKRVEEIMPDLSVLDNVDRAKQVLQTISKVFAERNVRDMQSLGAPLEMKDMSDEEIAAGVRMGLLDRNAALDFFRQFRATK